MSNLARCLGFQERNGEAEQLYRQVLEIRRRVLAVDHPDLAETLGEFAEFLEKMGRCAEAEPICREACSILSTRLPEGHRLRSLNASRLGGILCGLGRYSEAEPLLIHSYEALRDEPGLADHERKEILERIVRLYESWDAAEPGNAYATKAQAYRASLDQAKAE